MRALIFDLDGTLIDSAYWHTLAWQEAFSRHGLEIATWRLHRRIGLSGDLLVKAVSAEEDRPSDSQLVDKLTHDHARLFKRLSRLSRPLPGVTQLLRYLRTQDISFGIATTGKRGEIAGQLKSLPLPKDVIVVDGEAVQRAKPAPDLFLRCQEALGIERADCLVVGDSIWDVHAARRASLACVGVLTGVFGEQELYNAGAMRVYEDAQRLQRELNELGFQTREVRERSVRR